MALSADHEFDLLRRSAETAFTNANDPEANGWAEITGLTVVNGFTPDLVVGETPTAVLHAPGSLGEETIGVLRLDGAEDMERGLRLGRYFVSVLNNAGTGAEVRIGNLRLPATNVDLRKVLTDLCLKQPAEDQRYSDTPVQTLRHLADLLKHFRVVG